MLVLLPLAQGAQSVKWVKWLDAERSMEFVSRYPANA